MGGLGEGYDDKEKFRLLNTDGSLTDGWGRALRFFITADRDRPGSAIFWILSEGPDFDGRYPAKGTCNVTVWTPDPEDTMGKNYDETLPENKDNIIMKIYSHEFETVFQDQQAEKEKATQALLDRIKKALIGEAPLGRNSGIPAALGLSRIYINGKRTAGTMKTKSRPPIPRAGPGGSGPGPPTAWMLWMISPRRPGEWAGARLISRLPPAPGPRKS
nr:hypothetical protein [Desulfobacula sp.]